MRRTLAYLFLTALSLLGAAAVPVLAQDKKDSLVTLVSAKSAQLIERNGESFRKVTGPARFLHNNTYLLCDSALWNVTTNIIDAVGHVQIIQDRTRLSSGSLQYVVDRPAGGQGQEHPPHPLPGLQHEGLRRHLPERRIHAGQGRAGHREPVRFL